jgi:hypothetical protein
MTTTNDRPDLSSEGAPVIDKTILVSVNRNKYQVVRPTWASKPGLTDRLIVGRNVTLTLDQSFTIMQPFQRAKRFTLSNTPLPEGRAGTAWEPSKPEKKKFLAPPL